MSYLAKREQPVWRQRLQRAYTRPEYDEALAALQSLQHDTLSIDRRVRVVAALVEGNGINATARLTGVSKPTILKLLVELGTACAAYQDRTLRNLASRRIQCDEIWQFCYAKQKNVPTAKNAPDVAGDVWTWVALDADTKLVPSWLVGGRELPAPCLGINVKTISGHPDPKHVSTSYVERQNLTMRMSMKRFARLSNGFSKKIENHVHAVAIHYMHYNFARIHKTLRTTPAQAASVTHRLWEIADIVSLLDAKSEVAA